MNTGRAELPTHWIFIRPQITETTGMCSFIFTAKPPAMHITPQSHSPAVPIALLSFPRLFDSRSSSTSLLTQSLFLLIQVYLSAPCVRLFGFHPRSPGRLTDGCLKSIQLLLERWCNMVTFVVMVMMNQIKWPHLTLIVCLACLSPLKLLNPLFICLLHQSEQLLP